MPSQSAPFIRVLVGAALVVATLASPSAQRRRGGGDDPGVPIDTIAVLANPDAYIGKDLTMSAGVEQMLSPTAFVIDQRKAVSPKEVKAIGQPILVIAPYLNSTPDLKHYVLMRGQIIKFDQAALARAAAGYTLDLPAEVAAKYTGQPVLVASSIRDATYKELAMKPIPPPTPMDVSLTTAMKTISPAMASLRTSADASDAETVVQNVAKLKSAFAATEIIWDDQGVSYAAQVAREARDHVGAVERAAAGADWAGVKAGITALNQTCQTCHTIFRERQEDGTFRIKRGSI